MADVKPLKLVDQGGGAGRLEEFGAADKVPAENLPATEWASETVSQAEAEAGTATDRRAWTAQRVAQAVRGAVLTGLSTASAAAVTATDSVLGAMGKLQAQISGLSTSKLDANANAVSATKLQTARTINGVAFDGTANVNVADSTKVPLTGATGAALIPAGTEAQRPASPVNGCFRYNSETNQFEGYQDGEWGQVGGGQEGGGLPLFSVTWWPQRSAIPAGYVAADGQTLDRATYPDAWAGIQAGNVPTVAEATWLSTATERGKFTTGDGSTNFRLPDYNGKFAGSLGAVFLRGDGALSAAVAGKIQRDAMQGHKHRSGGFSGFSGATDFNPELGGDNYTLSSLGAYASLGSGYAVHTGNPVTDGANGTPRASSETRPLNVTGCWVVKLFGAIVNVGSADAAQLASDYANLAAALQTLDSQTAFTIIYPNGGSEASPANVAVNSRYEVDNPFPGFAVLTKLQLYIDGVWEWVGYTEVGGGGYGALAEQRGGAGSIIVKTGLLLMLHSSRLPTTMPTTRDIGTPLPCRVKVWKVKGAIA